MGHVVSDSSVSVDPEKVDTVMSWERPKSFFEIRSFLGLVMSLKVIYFQSIFLIDFYIKRPIYMQESRINSTKLLCVDP